MTSKQKGFSLIELLIVVAIILIIAAIAIPNFLRSRQSANEANAVSTLRTLATSQSAYYTTYGDLQGYASTMVALGPGSPCDPTHACLVDAALACASQPCLHTGYNFYMSSTSSGVPYTDYVFTATPYTWGATGMKNFCTSDEAMLRYELGATASLTAAVTRPVCTNFALFQGL